LESWFSTDDAGSLGQCTRPYNQKQYLSETFSHLQNNFQSRQMTELS